ncbi:MAG: TlyA family RNA methyltransferase [Oscillospiraceae bacterium]|nr:TlyA family RNA methyltransferase [Oscillospiraceae bacterium]
MSKIRLDLLLVERGLIESRERAKAIIMSGNVFVAGQRADKPGMPMDSKAEIEVRSLPEFVSRGGQKLEKALKYFDISPRDKICLDCGASTGGFTDCLLKNGASMVYAIDVGYGQLAWKIRSDPRVVTMERTNIRYVTADMFLHKPELATIDVSFISLGLVLPVLKGTLACDGEVVCLIKPQFEAGREKVGKKGVVKDRKTHIEVLRTFMLSAETSEFNLKGITYSPVRGPEGNVEYLAWLGRQGEHIDADVDAVVAAAHEELLDE